MPRTPSAAAPAIPFVSVEDLHFAWPQGPVFEGLELQLMPGLNWLTGDEGRGKTTLLRLLAGDLPLQRGRLRWAHQHDARADSEVFWMNPQDMAHESTSVKACFQQWAGRFPCWRDGELQGLIAGFGLQDHLEKTLHMLSTGSKRKVWLCAAWACGARLVLIEQPFAALDAPSIRFLHGLLEHASQARERVWLVADHSAPEGLPLARVIAL